MTTMMRILIGTRDYYSENNGYHSPRQDYEDNGNAALFSS